MVVKQHLQGITRKDIGKVMRKHEGIISSFDQMFSSWFLVMKVIFMNMALGEMQYYMVNLNWGTPPTICFYKDDVTTKMICCIILFNTSWQYETGSFSLRPTQLGAYNSKKEGRSTISFNHYIPLMHATNNINPLPSLPSIPIFQVKLRSLRSRCHGVAKITNYQTDKVQAARWFNMTSKRR